MRFDIPKTSRLQPCRRQRMLLIRILISDIPFEAGQSAIVLVETEEERSEIGASGKLMFLKPIDQCSRPGPPFLAPLFSENGSTCRLLQVETENIILIQGDGCMIGP